MEEKTFESFAVAVCYCQVLSNYCFVVYVTLPWAVGVALGLYLERAHDVAPRLLVNLHLSLLTLNYPINIF